MTVLSCGLKIDTKMFKGLLLGGLLLGVGLMYPNISGAAEANDMPTTNLLYLDNTYQFESRGCLLGTGADAKGTYLIFDQTIFYPQGGGQPADIGAVKFGEKQVRIGFTGFNNGFVHHYLYDPQEFDPAFVGQVAQMEIDHNRRMENACAHTAGHLLGSITAGITGLIPAKGYHFPDGPYVQFEGQLPEKTDTAALLSTINESLSRCVAEARNLKLTLVDPQGLSQLKLPTGFQIPAGKPCRIAHIEGFDPVPCGGTHINSLAEFAAIEAKKINWT